MRSVLDGAERRKNVADEDKFAIFWEFHSKLSKAGKVQKQR